MNIKQLLVAALLCLGATTVSAQQPLNLCCHPDDIKNWTAGANPDDAFNVAKVPLQQRFKEPQLMKANANQWYEGQICNSTILYPTCSICPSQGEVDNFLGYQPTYWQYMDKLIYWAGAASEGIINIPPAASTDAAHAQGVKVLGNIFFPPTAFGGTQAWVRQMLTVENGHYIYAIKLYELAKYFGFDGWFINEESGGGSNTEWVGFFNEFYAAAMADDPNTQMELQWYNASRTPNTQLLSTHLNTSQFLEYGSVGDKRSYASAIGCTADQIFSKIYSGVELAQAGHVGWQSSLNSSMPVSGHVGSLDLFCPEVKIWEDPAKSAFKSVSRNHGAVAYPIGKTVFDNEEDMWVNYNSDPSILSSSGWTGVSSRILERSAITSMPFLSDMGVGNGKHRFVEGQIAGTRDWYHSGMQSVLPTWRWWIENRAGLTVGIDWDNAYNVGSSFKFSGSLTAGDHLVRLYKTQIPVTAGGVYRIVYKTAQNVSVEAKISTESSVNPDVTLQATTTEKNGWTIADFDLSQLNGKTIYMLAFNLKAQAAVSNLAFNLGQVAVLPASYAPAAVAVSDLQSPSVLGENKGDLRFTWKYDWTADFDHFDIYTVLGDGTRTLVGQTRDQGFYIPTFERNGVDASVTVDLVPVMKDGKQRAAQQLVMNYPAPAAPTITVKPSKSFIQVGEQITLTMKGTGHPTAYEWVLPAGLSLASGKLTDQTITVKGEDAGKMVVTAKCTNAVGSSSIDVEAVEVFNAWDLSQVYNVVKGKTVVDYSGSTNSTEVPDKIIDGVRNPTATSSKWCNVSSDNWVVFDLEGAYRIYGFTIYDGNAGPESGVDQIDRYLIQLSQDGVNWTTVVDEEDRETESIKFDYICPAKARYVKLIPHVNGTLRIWEFEVFGRDDNNMTISVFPEVLNVNAGETKNITVSYDLNGDTREPLFTCTATSQGNAIIGQITENREAQTFTIPVKGAKIIGTDKITINVNNGGAYKELTVKVTIDSDEQPNVLAGLTAKLRKYKSDYSYEALYDEFETTALTDGDTEAEACLDIETPSVNKRDVWAIFEAPEGGWNLSKVKVCIPDNNYGENDNGNRGNVNNTIEICVGNDLASMETVGTFSNLGSWGELEYILPQYRNTKYLAIVCTLNAYFFASLAEVEAYEQFEEAIPVNGPVEIANWPHDVVVEALTAEEHANETLDGQGWCLFTSAVRENGAFCGADGKVVTKAGNEYTVAVDQNNSLVLKTANQPYTLNFVNPANCEEIYFIVISAEGQSTLTAQANYEDGTATSLLTVRPEDWFSSRASGSEAIYGLDRIKRGAGSGYAADQFDGRTQFRIFEYTLATDKSKRVSSLTFNSTTNGKIPTILGVAKKGYKTDTAVEAIRPASTAVAGIYTLSGTRINALQRGINIVRYSDGTTRKVLVK